MFYFNFLSIHVQLFRGSCIIQAIAIQLTNGFEVNLPSMSGRAVYPIISYFNHACVPNVTQSHKVVMPNEKNCEFSLKLYLDVIIFVVELDNT